MNKEECLKIIQNGIKKEQYDDKYFEAKRASEKLYDTQKKSQTQCDIKQNKKPRN